MTPREYLNHYVKTVGGAPTAATKLGIAYSTLNNILAGHRGVSPRLAQRMVAAEPLLDPNRLVWIRRERQ